jgi:hypothetical protein
MDNEDDLHPRLAIEYTKYGMRYGATRTIPDGTEQARVTAVVMPAWTFIPPQPALRVGTSSDVVKAGRRLVNAFIPRDDTSTWHFQVFYEYDRPFDAGFRNVEGGIRLDAAFRKLSNRSNDYLQDRERMKTAAFSGISGILVQDHAVGETQGDVADRTAEHLGTSDIAVIAWRRLMLNAAKALAGGADPPGIGVSYQAVRGETVPCAMGERWQDHLPLVAELAV